MAEGCVNRNFESSAPVEEFANDPIGVVIETVQVDAIDQPNWYLQEWFGHFGKRQAALVNELGWDKSRANHVWHGRQPYRRDTVNEIAGFLGIQPYELLMSPGEAIALRSLRDAARAIAANGSQTPEAVPSGKGRKTPTPNETSRRRAA